MSKLSTIFRSALMALALLVSIAAGVAGQEAPPIPKDAKIIGAEELKKMMDGKEKFLLVDARNGSEYKAGHIPTAVHIYDKEMDANKAKLPADKSFPIVFYCNGYPKCPRSANAATIATAWGYKKIHVYVGGYPDWEQKGYPIEHN